MNHRYLIDYYHGYSEYIVACSIDDALTQANNKHPELRVRFIFNERGTKVYKGA